MKEEDFPFQVVDQSKSTGFLQDFHHLDHDHQFDHHYHGSTTSSNPLPGIQTMSSCINSSPFEHCSYQENLVDEHVPMDMEQNNMMVIKPMNFVKKKTALVKGQWTAEEDRILIQLVERYGLRKWSHIAQVLPGRVGKQCRERWHNHLRPDIKETWSEEEDRVLIEFHKEIGNKWAEIAKRLPGRTENSIKNHWNATKRRQFSKRKCSSKYPRPSLLQDYVKSLDLKALSSSSVPARGRRKDSNKKKDIMEVEEKNNKDEDELYGQDRIVRECVFNDDFGFSGKLLEEGCSIDSLLDDLPQPDIDAFAHGF